MRTDLPLVSFLSVFAFLSASPFLAGEGLFSVTFPPGTGAALPGVTVDLKDDGTFTQLKPGSIEHDL